MSIVCETPSSRTCSSHFYCPEGGTWYVYANSNSTGFLGCCSIDPCAAGRPDGALYPARFNPALFNSVDPQDGADPSSIFYTCAVTSPPFTGCCSEAPCGFGRPCPIKNVTPAYLAGDISVASLSLFFGVNSNTAGPPYVVAAPNLSNTPPTWADPHGSKLSRSAIAGITIGFMIVSLIIAVLATIFRFTPARKRNLNQLRVKVPSKKESYNQRDVVIDA
jgi:hypothetical protein